MSDIQGKQTFADIEGTREVWTLDKATKPHVAVLQGDRPGVTLSGTPGQTVSVTVGPYSIGGIPQGDNGQAALSSTVHTTGTFEFPIAGASASTIRGTKVYFVAADGSLSLDGTGNTFFGVIHTPEGFVVRGTVLPVKIGVVA